jgi:hypothetical protein
MKHEDALKNLIIAAVLDSGEAGISFYDIDIRIPLKVYDCYRKDAGLEHFSKELILRTMLGQLAQDGVVQSIASNGVPRYKIIARDVNTEKEIALEERVAKLEELVKQLIDLTN